MVRGPSRMNSYLSSVLKEERKESGMTQKELAKKIGVGLMTLRKLEQNKENVTIELANEILKYFGKELAPIDVLVPKKKKNLPLPTKREVLKYLKDLKPILEAKYGISELGLFGSFSFGKQKKDSDLDILVRFKKPPSFSLEGSLTIMLENFFQGRKVDLTNKDEIKRDLKESILGSVIYV
jgi:uncharacterized protein